MSYILHNKPNETGIPRASAFFKVSGSGGSDVPRWVLNLEPHPDYQPGYEAGGNFIDTVNVYQNEQSEEWIGEWVEASQNRDSLVLATKFTMDYRSHAIGKGPRAANFAGNSRHSIHVSIRDSLKKLRTDYIGKSLTTP